MLAVEAGHLTNCKPVAARIFCSAKWWTEGGWKEEVGRVSGIEEDCARNELARGSDLLISYLFYARPYRFTFPDCYRVKHRRSTNISSFLSHFETPYGHKLDR